ncbi:MAG TPA: hypothetical protein VHO95_05130 [Candidatus Dormibacteraeota bacterium]|nr:hypothetical protein [Candidatus Dormibacteraeota bacterium]HEX2681317.1 hypothetical protein [Candidatus Dormibacteraeota bacterium]
MVKTRRAVLIPIWVALVAAALLLGLLLRAVPVDSPSVLLPQLIYAQPSPVPMTQPIGRSGTTSITNPTSESQPAGSEAPGAAGCPANPGSGLPCTEQP